MMINEKGYFILVVILVAMLMSSLISCASSKTQNPNGVDKLIPNSNDLQALRNIKKIRFSSDESVNVDDEKAAIGLKYNIEKIFKDFPELKLVNQGADGYDATLSIEVKGRAFGGKYISVIGYSNGKPVTVGKPMTMYSGSEISGSVSMKMNESLVYDWTFYKKSKWEPLPVNKESLVPPKNSSIIWSGGMWTNELLPVYSRIYGMLGDICGADELVRVFKNKSQNVYHYTRDIRESFKYISDGTKAVSPLISMAKDQSLKKSERGDAIEALGYIGGESSVDYLISEVKERNIYSVKAAMALGNAGSVRAVEPLIDLMRHYPSDFGTRRVIGGALQDITGFPPNDSLFFPGIVSQSLGEVDAWEKWWENNKNEYLKHE